MGPLKVLLVADLPGRCLAGAAVALHRAGLRIRALARGDSTCASWLEEAGVEFAPLRLHGRRDSSGIESIRWHLDDLRPQVLHLAGEQPIFNGLAAAKARPVKIVVRREDAGFASILKPLDWVSILHPRVDKILCGGEAARSSLLALGAGPLKIDAAKIVAVPDGYDLDWYRGPPLDLATLGVPRRAFVVNAVAGARPLERLTQLVRACDHLPADLPIHVLLCGAGTGDARGAGLIARSAYRDRFHLLGRRDDAPRIVAAADVSVLPGPHAEAQRGAVAESMAYETAPIVVGGGGIEELVEHERSGLVVPTGDARALAAAILRLYNDRKTCRELGRNARRRIASEFALGRSAAATLATYRALVSGP